MSAALRRAGSVSRWRHIRAIVSLPMTNAVLIPATIVVATEGLGTVPTSIVLTSTAQVAVGIGLLAAGIALIAGAIGLFVRLGQGTLAPWDPPRRLVVAGLYSHSRNPMKLGLFVTLLGEAVLLDSGPLLAWFASFTAANVLYVRLSEEPALATRFGLRYVEYCRNVPGWIPRWTAWRADNDGDERGRR